MNLRAKLGSNLSASLTAQEELRYQRHVLLPEVGREGQLRLKQARVLIVGVGGLGCPAALYLAAAGVGTLGLIDSDTVSLSNLQRQILFSSAEVGVSKVVAARAKLQAINSEINIKIFNTSFSPQNAQALLQDFDVILDGTDNFSTRYLINDSCVWAGKPMISAAVSGFDAQLSIFFPPQGPCYRCLYPSPPTPEATPNCSAHGVLGVLPGIVGTLQATEVIKFLLGIGTSLVGRLLIFDALAMSLDSYSVRPNPQCRSCGPKAQIKVENPPPSTPWEEEISVQELQRRFKEIQFLDVREPKEFFNSRVLGSLNIPLSVLKTRLLELDKNQETLVYCHMGIRSQIALELLQAAGFERIRHFKGGIIAMPHSLLESPCATGHQLTSEPA